MFENRIHFFKMHGAGNDFILIDNRGGFFHASVPEKIRQMCAPHTGIGADGLLLLDSSKKADFKVDYFNADGSRGEMCGNGARCAVALARQLNLAGQTCSVEFDKKIYQAEITANHYVRLRLPAPQFRLSEPSLQRLQQEKFPLFFAVDTGVPHLVIYTEEPLDTLDVLKWGKYFRHHPLFHPAGTNVNFVRKLKHNHLAIRVYERGVEKETLACGTGAVACGIFAAKQFHWQAPITIHSPGGRLQIDFDPQFKDLYLSGPVAMVFEGTLAGDFL